MNEILLKFEFDMQIMAQFNCIIRLFSLFSEYVCI